MGTKFASSIRCFGVKRFLSLSTLLLFFSVAVWALGLTAPTTIFEIDGDSVAGSTYGVANAINCDWNTLNGTKAANSITPAATCAGGGATFGAYGFIVGAPGEPNFSTGGSKDAQDIPNWAFTTTSTPDKDTLTHGYAASYTGPTAQGGDNILVFGAERFAVNGDSNIGIWFLQQNVSIPAGAAKGSFTGAHVKGDILIISAFTGGGGTSTISVYQWRPDICTASHYASPTSGQTNVCADTNLYALLVDLSPGGVPTCTSSTPACAVVNNQPIAISWPYQAKFGITNSNSVPTGGFYEGGIDLTNLIGGGAAPCFASFLFETRSSQSTSAVLKDFLVGSFPECHLSANKTVMCSNFTANGAYNYTYSGNVINDGGGDLYNVKVVDVRGQNYSCGNLPKGTSKAFGGSPLSTDCSITTGTSASFTSADHPASNEATASADTSPDGSTPPVAADTGVVNSTDPTNGACTAIPGLSVSKNCVTNFQIVNGEVVVRVDYAGIVTNTGNDNLSNVTVTDAASGTSDTAPYGPFSLTPGQSICYTNGQVVSAGPPATGCPTLVASPGVSSGAQAGAGSYFPSGANILSPTGGRISFSDTVTAAGKDAFNQPVPKSGDPKVVATATCPICPSGSCPN